MGIVIFDKNWQVPNLKVLVKRSVVTLIAGYVTLFKSVLDRGELITLFDLERKQTGTKAIDKRVYEELKNTAKRMTGDFTENMTILYDAYLRDLYLK